MDKSLKLLLRTIVDNSKDYLTFRCKNGAAHTYRGVPADGNIVAFLGEKSITIRCPDSACKHWTTLEMSFPGVNIDFRKAGIVQSVSAPGALKFKVSKPVVVLGD